MQGTPWEPIPARPGIELTDNIGAQIGPREIITREADVEEESKRRGFRLSREEVRDQGPKPGCKGCARALTDGRAIDHTENGEKYGKNSSLRMEILDYYVRLRECTSRKIIQQEAAPIQ